MPSSENKIAEILRRKYNDSTERKIGAEIERIAVWSDNQAFAYTPTPERPGAESLLYRLGRTDHSPTIKYEDGKPLSIVCSQGKISLEPGSQLEFATIPYRNLFSLKEQIDSFEKEVRKITNPWQLRWLDTGVNPYSNVEEVEVIPLSRYRIMTEYLSNRGKLATSMMRLTSSVQVNLDYTSEEEAVEMFKAALAATPISYALFSNSPIVNEQVTDFLSYRSQIWRETDKDRTGLFPLAFSEDFDFTKYAEFMWNLPLMFAEDREGKHIAANGKSLREINEGQLAGCIVDETNQLSALRQVFTETRIRPGYIEVRSIDGQHPKERYAAMALWTGMMYSPEARKIILSSLGSLSPDKREELWIESTKKGLEAKIEGVELESVIIEVIGAAKDELIRRDLGEERLLEPTEEIMRTGISPAEKSLRSLKI